jgi:hypothetical protein
VTAALNANDAGLARIAGVHLRIPDLPDQAARDRLEAEDIFIKSIDRGSAARALGAAPPNPGVTAEGNESLQFGRIETIHKASPDDPKHPGWPAGTEGGRGGQFRPKDASELTQKVKSLIARRALRTGLLAALRVGLEGSANLIRVSMSPQTCSWRQILPARSSNSGSSPLTLPPHSISSRTVPTPWRTFKSHRKITSNFLAMMNSTRPN